MRRSSDRDAASRISATSSVSSTGRRGCWTRAVFATGSRCGGTTGSTGCRSKHGDADPARNVSIIYDDYLRLEQRVDRLLSGSVLAVQGTMHMRRVVSNIEIEEIDGGWNGRRGEFRSRRVPFGRAADMDRPQYLHARGGWSGHPHGPQEVLLINSEHEMPLLQFLI